MSLTLCLFAAAAAVVTVVAGGFEASALLRRALTGDGPKGEAFRTLATRLIPVIRARVRRRLSAFARDRIGARDPDDLVQDIWLTLLGDGARQLLAYDPTRGMTLEGYVGRIAEREVQNQLVAHRAQKRGGEHAEIATGELPDGASGGSDPEQEAVARDLAQALSVHLEGALPERGRAVLRFLYTDGRAVDETARLLGVEAQVVYNWQHRIRGVAQAFLSGQSTA